MNKLLVESIADAPVKRGNRWLVTIGVPGEGSSGKYSAELWESYGSTAFPAGTKSYWKHSKPENRDPRDQIGKFAETFWNASEHKFQGYLEPFPRWVPVLQEMGSDIEMSISCGGTKDDDGNVITLEYHRTNSVDAVSDAGLSGSRIESLVESARSAFGIEPSADPGAGEKEKLMENQLAELKTLLESILGKLDAKVAGEAQVVADEAAAQAAAVAAVEAYSANIAAVEAARESLLPAQVKVLQESAKTLDVAGFTTALEDAKTVAKEAKSAVLAESAQGRDFGTITVKDATELGKVF